MPEGQPLCKKDDYYHTISVSGDKQRITFKNKKPIKDPNGNPISEYSYKVLYSTTNTIVMFLEGETRTIETGDLIVWVLMLDAKDIYRWRVYGSHPHSRNPVVGRRCVA